MGSAAGTSEEQQQISSDETIGSERKEPLIVCMRERKDVSHGNKGGSRGKEGKREDANPMPRQ